MRQYRKLLLGLVFAVIGLAVAFTAVSQVTPQKSNHWLIDVKDDTERFKRIEQMFGGFSASMQIVGERYHRTYDAVDEENYDLANYHWKKIKDAIELGYLRRPAREDSSVGLFLNGPWATAGEAFVSKEKDKARNGFLLARSACMACHLAEKVPFINDQPMFRRTAKFSE